MRDTGRLDHPRDLQLDRLGAETLEQSDPVTDHHWHQVDLELVEEAGLQVLLDDVRAARDRDVLVASRRPRSLEDTNVS